MVLFQFGILEISLILSGVSLVLTGNGTGLGYLSVVGISLVLSAFFPNFWRLFVIAGACLVLSAGIFFKGRESGAKRGTRDGKGRKGIQKKKGKI